MASSTPHTVRWGIMATGWIAEMFCKDLLVDPSSRDVHDVGHVIGAVAASSSKQKAVDFLTRIRHPSAGKADSPKTYGSYAELVADPNVDIVYVATPHSHHYQNAMLALQAGKSVLCEKALTVTAQQTKKLIAEAESRGLFFMEAVWTRYFPLSIKIRELVRSGEIGNVYRVVADFSVNNDAPDYGLTFDKSHRMVNPDLAGGALLDLGIYSLTWLFQILYQCQPGTASPADREAPRMASSMIQYETGADESSALVLAFPKHRSQGVALTSLRLATGAAGSDGAAVAVRISGGKGEIEVMGPACRPLQYRVTRRGQGSKVEVVDCPIPKDKQTGWGHGMFWEADEAARCLRDGRKESETLPWQESILIMELMDKALADGGVTYPDLITSDVFEKDGRLNTGR